MERIKIVLVTIELYRLNPCIGFLLGIVLGLKRQYVQDEYKISSLLQKPSGRGIVACYLMYMSQTNDDIIDRIKQVCMTFEQSHALEAYQTSYVYPCHAALLRDVFLPFYEKKAICVESDGAQGFSVHCVQKLLTIEYPNPFSAKFVRALCSFTVCLYCCAMDHS